MITEHDPSKSPRPREPDAEAQQQDTQAEQQPPSGRGTLVVHDIQLHRENGPGDTSHVVATVACERRACTLPIEACEHCERFERVESHEAGYTMLCRSGDDPVAVPTPGGPAPDPGDES